MPSLQNAEALMTKLELEMMISRASVGTVLHYACTNCHVARVRLSNHGKGRPDGTWGGYKYKYK